MKFFKIDSKSKKLFRHIPVNVQNNPVTIGKNNTFPSEVLMVDKVYRDDAKIVVEGWTTSKNDLGIMADNSLLKVQRLQFSRTDVAKNLNLPSGDRLGFMLTADESSAEFIALTWGDISCEKNVSAPLKITEQQKYPNKVANSSMSSSFDAPTIGAIAIDHGIALGPQGLLIYGWRHFIKGKVKNLRVHSPEGVVCEIMDACFNVPRLDVTQELGRRFMEVSELAGFICHIKIMTNPGDRRFIEILLDDDTSEWLLIPISNDGLNGVPLIKDLLARIPAPDRMRHRLFDLFDQHLGLAIDSISAARPAFSNKLEIRQFGIEPKNPKISVIVPLYGRYDFVRYQLSHFADDLDFQNVDLIYVIDDPKIIVPTHDLATVYFPVFNVPFRTVSYDSNRGFAGANNIGVGLARGETVVLLNSDVLPKHNGWLSVLQKSLDDLPDAGIVGPLLQFADESVQHAGMIPKKDARLPGFLLNIHPGKGQPWAGPEIPREFAMLTAACVMLRKEDYIKLGGLDEGYVIGDFEDSDLCLALCKLGKRLWLVPDVKLWHLERQSQNLESIAGYRQLLTLFNGWRFQKKIRDGLISDPTKFTPLKA